MFWIFLSAERIIWMRMSLESGKLYKDNWVHECLSIHLSDQLVDFEILQLFLNLSAKYGIDIREHHVFQTHLHFTIDFARSRNRISTITSSKKYSRHFSFSFFFVLFRLGFELCTTSVSILCQHVTVNCYMVDQNPLDFLKSSPLRLSLIING